MKALLTERELVKKAVEDRSMLLQLKKYVKPYVRAEAEKFVNQRNLNKELIDKFAEVGLEPFVKVFGIYVRNGNHVFGEEGHFPAYYRWWARQAMVKYNQKNKNI